MTEKNTTTAINPEKEERQKILRGELISNTKDKFRLFTVYETMGSGEQSWYLLMELSALKLQWVKDEDMQRWLNNGTFQWWKHTDYNRMIDRYWFELKT